MLVLARNEDRVYRLLKDAGITRKLVFHKAEQMNTDDYFRRRSAFAGRVSGKADVQLVFLDEVGVNCTRAIIAGITPVNYRVDK